jgi:hypothetical protein
VFLLKNKMNILDPLKNSQQNVLIGCHCGDPNIHDPLFVVSNHRDSENQILPSNTTPITNYYNQVHYVDVSPKCGETREQFQNWDLLPDNHYNVVWLQFCPIYIPLPKIDVIYNSNLLQILEIASSKVVDYGFLIILLTGKLSKLVNTIEFFDSHLHMFPKWRRVHTNNLDTIIMDRRSVQKGVKLYSNFYVLRRVPDCAPRVLLLDHYKLAINRFKKFYNAQYLQSIPLDYLKEQRCNIFLELVDSVQSKLFSNYLMHSPTDVVMPGFRYVVKTIDSQEILRTFYLFSHPSDTVMGPELMQHLMQLCKTTSQYLDIYVHVAKDYTRLYQEWLQEWVTNKQKGLPPLPNAAVNHAPFDCTLGRVYILRQLVAEDGRLPLFLEYIRSYGRSPELTLQLIQDLNLEAALYNPPETLKEVLGTLPPSLLQAMVTSLNLRSPSVPKPGLPLTIPSGFESNADFEQWCFEADVEISKIINNRTNLYFLAQCFTKKRNPTQSTLLIHADEAQLQSFKALLEYLVATQNLRLVSPWFSSVDTLPASQQVGYKDRKRKSESPLE